MSINYKYLRITINSIDVSFFASSWLLPSHVYVPLLSPVTLLKDKIAFFFPVTIFVISLYQVTFAGLGLPSVLLHSHAKQSPWFTVVSRGQVIEIFGLTEVSRK